MANTPRERHRLSEGSHALEGCAEQNTLKLSKGRFRVLHVGRKNLVHQKRVGANMLESCSAEKDLEVLKDNKLSMSQLCGHKG